MSREPFQRTIYTVCYEDTKTRHPFTRFSICSAASWALSNSAQFTNNTQYSVLDNTQYSILTTQYSLLLLPTFLLWL